MFRVITLSVLVAYATATTWGDSCQSDSVCTDTDSKCIINGGCDWGRCGCEEDWTTNAAATACVEVTKKKVGESCSAHTDVCMGSFTSCDPTTDVCTCHTGLVGSSGDKDCDWKKDLAKNTEVCTLSTDCESYKYYYKRKWEGKLPEHSTQTAGCSGGVCTCTTGFVTDSTLKKCKSFLNKPEEACSLSSDCDGATYPGLMCVSGACGCEAGTEYMSGWDVYDEYKKACMPSDSVVNIKKGEMCATATSTNYQTCAKGLTCDYCPNDNVNKYCQDGAGAVVISLVLLIGSLLLQL